MALMLLARADYFDNWTFPVGLAVLIGLSAAYVVASAVLLRRASETARRHVIQALSGRRLAQVQPKAPEHITQVLEDVRALKEGAFLPYTELPVFRAVALPSGAYGVFAIIDLLANNF